MKITIVDAKAGIVSVKPKRRKVAIIANSNSRKNAPYDDGKWECWGINEIEQPRAERWFEMHPWAIQNRYEENWLSRCTKPVYLLQYNRQIPMGVRYPLERVLTIPGARKYFTSTMAYQVALAIFEGFEEIGLWGMALPNGSPRERTVERACLEFWLGLAAGKGIKVTTMPDDGLISQKYLYGYNYFREKTDIARKMSKLGLAISLRNDIFGAIIACAVDEDNFEKEIK